MQATQIRTRALAPPDAAPLSRRGAGVAPEVAAVLALQRSAGNRAVGRMLNRARLQRAPAPPSSPPPMKRDRYLQYPTLAGYYGAAPIWQYPAPDRPDSPPRFVPRAPDPELPWRTDQILDAPLGPEFVTRANVGTWMHDNFELVDALLLEDAESLTTERLPPGLEREYRIPDPKLAPLWQSRVDRVDWANFEVIEIKPEHLREQGEREAAIYAQEMDKFHAKYMP